MIFSEKFLPFKELFRTLECIHFVITRTIFNLFSAAQFLWRGSQKRKVSLFLVMQTPLEIKVLLLLNYFNIDYFLLLYNIYIILK